MATLAGLRARVRLRLEESSPAIWSDAELDECIAAALEAFALRAPLEVITSSSIPDGSRSAALPSGTRQVLRVELGDGHVLPRRGAATRLGTDAEGADTGAGAGTVGWEVFANALRFTHPLAAQTLRIWHTSTPTIAEVLSADEGVLVLGGVACALQARAMQDAKRGVGAGDAAATGINPVVARAEQAFAMALDRRTRRARMLLA